MSRHSISIVMPFRNAAATLPECIDSIRAQTIRRFEVIAVDDGSSDESAALCERAGFRVVRSPGLVNALNAGLEAASGAFIARMDADDVMHPERLEAQLDVIERGFDLVATQVEMFPEVREGYREYLRWQNAVITPEQIDANIYVESPFAHPSVMFRRRMSWRGSVEATGGAGPGLDAPSADIRYEDGLFPEDYELWLRMHAAGARMIKVPRVLLAWRESANRASRVDPRYSREAFDRLRARHLAQDRRVRGARELVIWGAGRVSRRRVQLMGIAPVAWVDVDPRKIGRTIDGAKVHHYEWLRGRASFVIVNVTNHHAREEVVAALESFGYAAGRDFL
jgi:glycosyltransferase involved in cell wall biosynthesis